MSLGEPSPGLYRVAVDGWVPGAHKEQWISRLRRLALPLMVVAVLSLLAFVGLAAVNALRPRISEAQAVEAAVRKMAQVNPQVKGYAAVYAHYEAAPWQVYDQQGRLRFSQSKSHCLLWVIQLPGWACPPGAVWAIELRAPSQGAFREYEAFLLVDAKTGEVGAYGFGSSN